MRTPLKSLLLLLAACACSAFVHAQTEWPQKPVRIVVPQAAGSSPDLAARKLADRLSKEFSQAFIVENRSGAGGAIAAETVARATDGHTLFYATSAPLVLNMFVSGNLRYDPVQDFVGIAKVTASPFVLVVNPKLPVRSVPELIAYDRANPVKLSFASDGVKNLGGLIGEMFNRAAGTRMVQVPYNSTARAATDTIAGQTQVSFQSVSVVLESVRNGDLRAIALTSGPLPLLSNVPLISESVPGFEVVGWAALVAPKSTPKPVVDRLNVAINRIVQDPAWQHEQQTASGGLVKNAGTPAQLDAFLGSERQRWGDLIRQLGIVPE